MTIRVQNFNSLHNNDSYFFNQISDLQNSQSTENMSNNFFEDADFFESTMSDFESTISDITNLVSSFCAENYIEDYDFSEDSFITFNNTLDSSEPTDNEEGSPIETKRRTFHLSKARNYGKKPKRIYSQESLDLPSGVNQAFIHPLGRKGHLTSDYGIRMHPILHVRKFHNGEDWGAPLGTKVFASAGGVVIKAYEGIHPINGKYVVIKHPHGYTTKYLHLNDVLVNEGDPVKQGQLIGKVGSTGRSTGPHLHFIAETPQGKTFDPDLSGKRPVAHA